LSESDQSYRLAVDVRMLLSSGIGTYLQNLLPRVLSDSKFAPTALIARSSNPELLEHLPESRIIPFNGEIYSVREQVDFPRLSADLCWFPNYNKPLKYRRKFVTTVHDVYHLVSHYGIRDWNKQAYAWLMFRHLRKQATAVLCVSRFTANELRRLVDIDERKIHVTPLGVDESWFHIERAVAPDPRKYLLAVGNVKPHKNLSRLLDAFALLTERIPHKLYIVGRKEGFITGDPAVLEKASRLGERVHFTGHVDDATLKQYFANADALVFPSLYEGFGLPPLEAMACGCPVIASRVASIPEVCGDAVAYFDPLEVPNMAEQISKVISDRVLREELCARGRERARLFRWDDCALATADVLKRHLES
jgi:glycosyltransferase involved in cell wall biosynthesis